MKNSNVYLAALFIFAGSMILANHLPALANTDDPIVVTEIVLLEQKPPKPKPIPKSLVVPAVTAWYASANEELLIQTAFPQGALVVCIENQKGGLVYQQTINGNLPKIVLYPKLKPGVYKITIYGANMELCGVLSAN